MKHSILIAALVACSRPDTIVHVELTGDSTPSVDSYELRIGSDIAQAEPLPAIDLAVPDGLADESSTLEVWGLSAGEQVAYGTAAVEPMLHATIDVDVTLGAIDCGQWCIEGGVECMGSGIATCTEGSDGCLAWSTPTACPSETPTCTNGTCGGSAAPVACSIAGSVCDDNDACTQDDTCANGICAGTPLCTTAPANADPTCSNGTCGFACHMGYVDTGAACVVPERVFATSATYTGDVGGLAGADASCQSLATAAGLAGTYDAWLSDSTTAVITRLAHVDGYALVDGTVIATSWAQLISGTLLHPIDLDEAGMPLASNDTWTDTLQDGTITQSIDGDALDCDEWTGSNGTGVDGYGFGGVASATDVTWTAATNAFDCTTTARLYCFEQ